MNDVRVIHASTSLCAVCGYPTKDPGGVCRHHSESSGDDWAHANRLMCEDFLHRGIAPPTPQKRDRFARPYRYEAWPALAIGIDLPPAELS